MLDENEDLIVFTMDELVNQILRDRHNSLRKMLSI